jgi:cytochrome c biogenesis protein CcdA
MKRFLIFGLLGPPLGFVTAFWVMLPALDWSLGASSHAEFHQIVLLPVAYMIGIVPALLAALFDHVLARRKARWRILWTTLVSTTAGFLPIAASMFDGFVHGPYVLLFGLIGAVPGAICAWLSRA